MLWLEKELVLRPFLLPASTLAIAFFWGGSERLRSGEVESAHRYIPQKRLKIPGATWHPDIVNPMLALRVIRANEWWSDFWTHLIEKKLA